MNAAVPSPSPRKAIETTSRFLIRFYEAKLFQGSKEIKFSKLLEAIIKKGAPLSARHLVENNSDYQVRGLSAHDNNREIRGCFVRFRPDIPVSGSKASLDEKEIILEDGHNIIEKIYFSLFIHPNYEVLAFQQSLEGGSISALARYLSAVAGHDRIVAFNDILTEESLDDLLNGKLIKQVEFRVAKPRSTKYTPDPDDAWTQQAMEFMANTGATSFQAKIGIRAQSRGIFSNVKNPIKKLLDSPQTRKLKIKLSDIADPVDLFADRVKARITVKSINGQPKADEIYKAIWAEKIKLESSLDAYFG
ncbi:hypothetical protein SAMN02745962_04237 [Pseudomonas sp. LAIL14HWK12:I11]|jgi:hypothetical protein|nr:hypothetical protein SAMN02745962_04237 [Pseudomonas sp. LAIL14HWK12:I11]SMR78698.1 hypothetical protein SAMN05661028_03505 [Pseudomonas sp. LAIL14HWK12:I10]SOD06774.1 hypothetical protein SAMN05660296_04500 [Pseudomonas sp. LAIL14HWK12:I8]